MKARKTKRINDQISKSQEATPQTSRRVKTKKALLESIQAERKRLDQTLSVLTEVQLIQPGVVGEWSIKDTLAHLTAWEQRLLQRVRGKPERGVELSTPNFNAQVFRENRNRTLVDVQAESQRSYSAVVRLAENLSDLEVQQWWSAFAFNTYGHYRWARQNIRRWQKGQSQ